MFRVIRRSAYVACVVVLVSAFVLAGTAAAQSTVEISTAQELGDINEDLDGDYVLTDDIDASDVDFEPIGDQNSRFTGRLDGNGHTISGLTIEPSEGQRRQDFVGLFGVVGEDGKVEDVGVEDSRVVGYQDVGGIAGVNYGEVSRSYFDGYVGGHTAVGGLVGLNRGELNGSYATAMVEATGNDVGGFVGSNLGNVTEAYAAVGVVSDEPSVEGAFGVGGVNAERVYWDTEVSGVPASDGVVGLTTDEMTGDSARESMEFDFNETWKTTQGYPALAWQSEDAVAEVPDGETGGGGEGSDEGDETEGTEGDDTEDSSDGGEGMPGFGAVVAVVSLAVGLGLRRKG